MVSPSGDRRSRVGRGSRPVERGSGRSLLEFLLDPASYAHRPRSIHLVQTHASLVVLASPFVFKIKKPVDFGFLNFSTLAKRHAACLTEVELNRRLTSGVYLGVVAIVRDGGRLRFAKTGERSRVVEYAVQMRRLSSRYFLDHRLRRRAVGRREIMRIVAFLARFYRAQRPTKEVSQWGTVAHLRFNTDENFTQAERHAGGTISRESLAAIRAYTNGFLRRHGKFFTRRVREGWIRDCHGDLHAEHIHITPRAVNIYDCIEFNDRIRYGDVASDVAFLAMDLDFEGRADLASEFVAKMARALRDDDLSRLMDFYKCYRAFVRGKVESLHSVAAQAPAVERLAAADRARRYFQLALRYATIGSAPAALVVMGGTGSGKSRIAQALASEFGCDVFSSDRIRKALAGRPLYERTPSKERAGLYNASMTARTYGALLDHALGAVRRGEGVVLDATFGNRVHRHAFRRALSAAGANAIFVEAHAPAAVVRKRLARREHERREVSDARLGDYAELTRRYEGPVELPRSQRIRVSTTATPPATLAHLLKQLAGLRLASQAVT